MENINFIANNIKMHIFQSPTSGSEKEHKPSYVDVLLAETTCTNNSISNLKVCVKRGKRR